MNRHYVHVNFFSCSAPKVCVSKSFVTAHEAYEALVVLGGLGSGGDVGTDLIPRKLWNSELPYGKYPISTCFTY